MHAELRTGNPPAFSLPRNSALYAKTIWDDIHDESVRLVAEIDRSGRLAGNIDHICLLRAVADGVKPNGQFVAWADPDFCELLADASSVPFGDPQGVDVEFGDNTYGTLALATALSALIDGYLTIGGMKTVDVMIHAVSWFYGSGHYQDGHRPEVMMGVEISFVDEETSRRHSARVTYQNDEGQFSALFVRAGLILRAFFDLLHQDNVADVRIEHTASTPAPDSQHKKRVRQPDVRVVSLCPGTDYARAYFGVTREYRHRWMVRGHWRHQTFVVGGERTQRRIWIAPYLKGPHGAPLLTSPKVYTVRGDH